MRTSVLVIALVVAHAAGDARALTGAHGRTTAPTPAVTLQSYDNPPDSTWSCAQQKEWGKCTAPWMSGHCSYTCAGEFVIGDTVQFASGFAQGYVAETLLGPECYTELDDFVTGATEVAAGLVGVAGCFDGTGADCSDDKIADSWSSIVLGIRGIKDGLVACEKKIWFEQFLSVIALAVPELRIVSAAYVLLLDGQNIAHNLEAAWERCRAEQWFDCGFAMGDLAAVLSGTISPVGSVLVATSATVPPPPVPDDKSALAASARVVLVSVAAAVAIALIAAGILRRRRGLHAGTARNEEGGGGGSGSGCSSSHADGGPHPAHATVTAADNFNAL
jgi:hypothetical protein